MEFFSSDKRLQEIFFQNHHPLPPPQELNGRPLYSLHYFNQWYVVLKIEGGAWVGRKAVVGMVEMALFKAIL